MNRSLDLSQICSQNRYEETVDLIPFEKETSLQSILEQFDKMDAPSTTIKKSSARCSIQLHEDLIKLKNPKRTSVKVNHDLLLHTDRFPQKLNSTPLNLPQTTKEARPHLIDHLKLSNDSIQPSGNSHRTIYVPIKQEQLRSKLEPIKTNFTPRRRSQLSEVKQEELIDEQQPRSAGLLNIKSKHSIVLNDSPVRISTESKRLSSFGSIGNFSGNQAKFSHPLKSIERLQLNFIQNGSNGQIDSPMSTKSSNRRESSNNLNFPDAVVLSKPLIGSNFFESPVISSRRAEEPSLIPLGNDYLLKVIFNKSSGSNGGSSTGSPMNVGTPENMKTHEFGKRGSFSTFKRLVESEVNQNS